MFCLLHRRMLVPDGGVCSACESQGIVAHTCEIDKISRVVDTLESQGHRLNPLGNAFPTAAVRDEEECAAAGAAEVDRCRRRQRAPRVDWAGLLRKAFAVDVFVCRLQMEASCRPLLGLLMEVPESPRREMIPFFTSIMTPYDCCPANPCAFRKLGPCIMPGKERGMRRHRGPGLAARAGSTATTGTPRTRREAGGPFRFAGEDWWEPEPTPMPPLPKTPAP